MKPLYLTISPLHCNPGFLDFSRSNTKYLIQTRLRKLMVTFKIIILFLNIYERKDRKVRTRKGRCDYDLKTHNSLLQEKMPNNHLHYYIFFLAMLHLCLSTWNLKHTLNAQLEKSDLTCLFYPQLGTSNAFLLTQTLPWCLVTQQSTQGALLHCGTLPHSAAPGITGLCCLGFATILLLHHTKYWNSCRLHSVTHILAKTNKYWFVLQYIILFSKSWNWLEQWKINLVLYSILTWEEYVWPSDPQTGLV